METDEFEAVRGEADALTRARRATSLIATYQQRSTELARLRRLAIEQAARERGMTLAAVAAEIGLSKGRITQIRQSAPPPERGLFGVGPITVAVPTRAMPGRGLPVISAEDSIAAERMTQVLTDYGFTVEQYRIPIGGEWTPMGDVVAICGPKSSHVTADAMESDPYLSFSPNESGKWVLQERSTGRVFTSGMDADLATASDVAYIGKLNYRGTDLFVIAGVHAIGSVGAVHYFAGHAAELYAQVGDHRWSAIVASSHDGETITSSELVCPPRIHE
ncbi:hypothetical protein Kisp01_10170 [Kineosporia sp. NBRC 101677]|uniref:hypothetical protein n=1 Tax=Kineosporia sp. NBRC 101677 TaxID=3032197 RepID=UPI0024A14ED6|nr:hypothetical protein [Kineosporia sp. NBRC 101677]GLY14001.1 hypothetical protein Kisp01_10170 [Kineosporia sp. NBRC 101677]